MSRIKDVLNKLAWSDLKDRCIDNQKNSHDVKNN